MPIPRDLALTPDQLDELMLSSWNMRIATIGPGTRINLTPLWFGWAGGCIYTYCRGQKVENLRRNPVATILVDRNERFPELQGAMFQGMATVLEDEQRVRPREQDARPVGVQIVVVPPDQGEPFAGLDEQPLAEPVPRRRDELLVRLADPPGRHPAHQCARVDRREPFGRVHRRPTAPTPRPVSREEGEQDGRRRRVENRAGREASGRGGASVQARKRRGAGDRAKAIVDACLEFDEVAKLGVGGHVSFEGGDIFGRASAVEELVEPPGVRVVHEPSLLGAVAPRNDSRKAARERWTWLIAVPSGISSDRAISRYDSPSTLRSRRHAEAVGSSPRRARTSESSKLACSGRRDPSEVSGLGGAGGVMPRPPSPSSDAVRRRCLDLAWLSAT